MKRLLLIFLILICLVGCGKKEVKDDSETVRTESEKQMYEFLTKNVLTVSTEYDNRCFIFTDDGKFLRYYSSELVFPKWNNILMKYGTYKYKDGTIYLNYLKSYNLNYDSKKDTHVLEIKDEVKNEQFEKFNLVEKDTPDGKFYYAGEYPTFRLYIVKDNVPLELSDYLRKSLKNDLKDFKLEEAKALEIETKDQNENSSIGQ